MKKQQNLNMNIDRVITNFRDFLVNSWSFLPFKDGLINRNSEDEVLLEIWLQSNWELIVEQVVCKDGEFLFHYGNGADYEGNSSRVLYPEAKPTHIISGNSFGKQVYDHLNDDNVVVEKFKFERFVKKYGNNYFSDSPPFDFAILIDSDEREVMVDFKSLQFTLDPLK